MSLSSIFTSIVTMIGIGLIGVIILLLVIQAIFIYIAYKIFKKYPYAGLFLFIVLMVIATVEVITPGAIILGVTTWVGCIIALMTQYTRLKSTFKPSQSRAQYCKANFNTEEEIKKCIGGN